MKYNRALSRPTSRPKVTRREQPEVAYLPQSHDRCNSTIGDAGTHRKRGRYCSSWRDAARNESRSARRNISLSSRFRRLNCKLMERFANKFYPGTHWHFSFRSDDNSRSVASLTQNAFVISRLSSFQLCVSSDPLSFYPQQRKRERATSLPCARVCFVKLAMCLHWAGLSQSGTWKKCI